jgi:hypothetical protein
MPTPFRPWLRQQAIGLGLLIGGLLIALAYPDQSLGLFAGGLAVAVTGAVLLQRAFVRMRGQRIERDAIASLRAAASRWGIKVESTCPLRSGGDLDALVVLQDGTRWAIEVKAYEGVLIKRGFFGRTEHLVRSNGRRFPRDPCVQVGGAAREYQAKPVIWLPAASRTMTLRLKSNVVVVQGDEGQLGRAIGAKRWWMR